MLDFKRIGGEIISSPLNENFRKLRNDISISNTNLVFSETEPVKDTIADMLAIENPDNAQVCYVISSGELYRYATHDKTWHKIADFGQTFRQGFLSSGTVVLEKGITLDSEINTILHTPKMLVYFKNQPGDKNYLKGMYLIEEQTIDLSTVAEISGANVYSLFVDYMGHYSFDSGIPQYDDVNKIYIGSFVVKDDKTIANQDFIYTLPDMAYTADRSKFLFDGGTVAGLRIRGKENALIERDSGYYYDEGINYITGDTDNYPVDNDKGTNYNLKYFESESPATKIYYLIPDDAIANGFEDSAELIYNKYWNPDTKALEDVDPGYYTIQHHLVTPTGQNIFIYGSKLYNTKSLAVSALNSAPDINFDFPYVEVSRIIVGNPVEGVFNSTNESLFEVYSLGTLSRVGTVNPEFADNLFKIYSGVITDTTPMSARFVLDDLVNTNNVDLYNLKILPYNYTAELFVSDTKYIGEGLEPARPTHTDDRTRTAGNLDGYYLADNEDINILRNRIRDIETEIWALQDTTKTNIYEQSIRYRLFSLETRMTNAEDTITENTEKVTDLENNKVDKTTKVNEYTLDADITLKTGDIGEGQGNGVASNLWYTEERVSANTDVAESTAHRNTISSGTLDQTLSASSIADHIQINPHNLSTDDIKILQGSQKLFITPEEERRIRADKLPDDTIQALADLDAKNIDSIKIDSYDGSSVTTTGKITQIGNVTDIRFYEDGVELNVSEDGKTLIVECKGQVDEDMVMLRHYYASEEMKDPENPELIGTVDKAVTAIAANAIHGIASAGADKYYGTNEEGLPGIYDIQKFVTTADADSFTNIDQVTFVPIDGSVQEKHLEESLINKINNNYHKVYNTGTLSSAEINTFNFGDNLTVTVENNIATINAVAPGESAVTNFANLADVSVTYTGNRGKMLIVNEAEDGVTLSNALSMDEYMLESVYVDTTDVTKVKKAVQADNATNATTAATATNALAVNTKVVDDTKTTSGVLWTAEKIISNTSSQITNESVTTHSGTSVPSNSLGKNGDLYILIEG